MNAEAFERRLLRRWLARVVVGPPTDRPAGPCWLWTGAHNAAGYSRFSVGVSHVYAHRWGYERFRGPIPEELELDHIVCDTPGCVNPWHVEPSTGAANTLRGSGTAAVNARKTECTHGHPFDEANTYYRPTGGRACRTCAADRRKAARCAGA